MAVLSWKMAIGPLLLLLLRVFEFQYDDPANRLLVRVFYGLSQIAILLCCGYIGYEIKRGGDSTKTVQLKKAATSGEEGETVTYREYDFSELRKLLSKLVMGAVMTTFIHVSFGAVPPLLFQAVLQPMSVLDHPLFSIYVLHKNADDDVKLKRPFPDNSPFSLQAQANEARASNTVQSSAEVEHQEEAQVGSEGEEPEEVQQDVGASAVTSDSQTTLSTTERRHPRLQTVEQ